IRSLLPFQPQRTDIPLHDGVRKRQPDRQDGLCSRDWRDDPDGRRGHGRAHRRPTPVFLPEIIPYLTSSPGKSPGFFMPKVSLMKINCFLPVGLALAALVAIPAFAEPVTLEDGQGLLPEGISSLTSLGGTVGASTEGSFNSGGITGTVKSYVLTGID